MAFYDFENGATGLQFKSLGYALEYAHHAKTRIVRVY